MLERTVEYHLTTRVRCGLCHSGKHNLLESARFALKKRHSLIFILSMAQLHTIVLDKYKGRRPQSIVA